MSSCEKCKHYESKKCDDCYVWDYEKGEIYKYFDKKIENFDGVVEHLQETNSCCVSDLDSHEIKILEKMLEEKGLIVEFNPSDDHLYLKEDKNNIYVKTQCCECGKYDHISENGLCCDCDGIYD